MKPERSEKPSVPRKRKDNPMTPSQSGRLGRKASPWGIYDPYWIKDKRKPTPKREGRS